MFETYNASSGRLAPVWRLEIQTRPDDVTRLLDAVTQVDPLRYGRYLRNATVSAVGAETMQPEENSTTTTHVDGFQAGGTATYPVVQLYIALPREMGRLEQVMDAVTGAHHYEEPIIYVREEWASRSAYDPKSSNPNRWWNDGRGLPDQVSLDVPVTTTKEIPE